MDKGDTMSKETSDFRYNTGDTKVPWAAVGENYNADDTFEFVKFLMQGKGAKYNAALRDAKLTFEYPYGLLQVKVMTDDVVEGFRLESPAAAISGAGKYTAGGYVMDAASSRTVELALSEPVHTKTDTGNTAFWFVLPCGSYALLNLTITFEGGEESGCALQNITIKRVTPTDFEVAAVEVGTDDLDGFVPETVEFDK